MAQYLCVAALLHKYDVLKLLHAYDQKFSRVEGATSITPSPSTSNIDIPILTSASIALCRNDPITTSVPYGLSPSTPLN